MRIFTAIVVLTTAAASTAAFAQNARLTDAQFVKAAYCRGLAGEAVVGANLDAVLKANEPGRQHYVIDRAQTARQDGKREVRRSTGPAGKADVARQLTTICAALGG